MSRSPRSIDKLIQGIESIPRSAKVLTQARLWPWVIAPGFFISLLVPGIIATTILCHDRFSIWFHNALPEWAQIAWLSAIFSSLLWLVLALLVFFIGSQVILALYAPFFGIMSERIESHLGGAKGRPFSFSGFFRDIARAFAVLAITLGKWLLWTVLAFTISWIPVVGQISSLILLFVVNGYFTAMGSIDPCLERRDYTIRGTFGYCRRERFGLVGLGAVYQLLMFIPLIGWFLAPGLLVAGASLYCIENSD